MFAEARGAGVADGDGVGVGVAPGVAVGVGVAVAAGVGVTLGSLSTTSFANCAWVLNVCLQPVMSTLVRAKTEIPNLLGKFSSN